jgi:phosphoribosylanthranilate isomerase
MVRVKICGITREADVKAAVSDGADAIGFITGLEESPRNLSLEKVAELSKYVPPFVTVVLVTTAEILSKEEDRFSHLRFDALQLYGDSIDPDVIRGKFGVSLIRPYGVGGTEETPQSAVRGFDALLLDTHRKGMRGGTGKTSNWTTCRRITKEILPTPVILSGGLSPDNVLRAIRSVKPYAVDVSSGVEAFPGVKDHIKLRQFIMKAKGEWFRY